MLISMLEPRYCPVSLIHIYFAMARIDDNSKEYIFRNIHGNTVRSQKLRPTDIKMTYTRVREIVLKERDVLESQRYFFHRGIEMFESERDVGRVRDIF